MTTDAVTVSTIVGVAPAIAFQVFCEEIDRWWRRNPGYRRNSDSVVRFVERPTRRLVEVTLEGTVDLGHVLRWEPPHLLQMSWRVPIGGVPESDTTVEVRFDPDKAGTRVTIVHAGWTDLEIGGAAASVVGLWWSNPLVDYLAACSDRIGTSA
jgi:uncharacterized protein YndB with AHSA1/START domain